MAVLTDPRCFSCGQRCVRQILCQRVFAYISHPPPPLLLPRAPLASEACERFSNLGDSHPPDYFLEISFEFRDRRILVFRSQCFLSTGHCCMATAVGHGSSRTGWNAPAGTMPVREECARRKRKRWVHQFLPKSSLLLEVVFPVDLCLFCVTFVRTVFV